MFRVLFWAPLSLVFLGIGAFAAVQDKAGDAQQDPWSLRPRSHPQPPQFTSLEDRHWVRNRVDAFVLAKLRKQGLGPAPEADRLTLIRRLTFDLTGLPPSPAEVQAFVQDAAPDAYERLVERLLASPHYGERWGRHWLDVVRFAESEGFEYDRLLPGMWRYRDYVIRSFNEDKPFDRFVCEQLAGDELEPNNHDCSIAAGFHRLGPVRRNAGNQMIAFSRLEVITERTDAIGAVFLGLTVGCARCHNHRFDDIPQEDYYRLQAFLAATDEFDLPLDKKGEPGAKAGKGKAAVNPNVIHTVRNFDERRLPIHVLKRGDPERKGKQVGLRALSLLLTKDAPELPAATPNPRTILARWIASAEHPLTARVMVNRVWQHHFGAGIVETANDFGTNGGSPSHAELLDELANTFVDGGWRIKPLHRLILLSSTYRQSSQAQGHQAALAKDPGNRLLWRFPRRRLAAEEVRDAMLSAAGVLNLKAGGPSVMLPVEPDLPKLLYDPKQWAVTPDAAEHNRRSVYLLAKRNLRLPFAEVFDQPDTLTSCAGREKSTHVLQALEMLNGKTSNQLAQALAARLEKEAGAEPAAQVELAFRLIAGRPPNPRELELGTQFLQTHAPREFALAMFSLNAFLYVN
jgi:hypothetical protein